MAAIQWNVIMAVSEKLVSGLHAYYSQLGKLGFPLSALVEYKDGVFDWIRLTGLFARTLRDFRCLFSGRSQLA